MSSNSMDEDSSPEMPDIIPLHYDENNQEDYNETWDNEVYDIFPIFERLHINDNEPMGLQSGFSTDLIPSSLGRFEEVSLADSSNAVSSIFVGDMLDPIRLNEGTKAAVGNQNPLFGTEETQQVYFTHTRLDFNFPDVIQKASEGRESPKHLQNAKEENILNTSKETKETGLEISCIEEPPLDFTLRHNLDHNSEALSTFETLENETEFSIIASEEKVCIDPETGEMIENSSILQDTSGSKSLEKALDQWAHGMADGIVSDFDSSKLSHTIDDLSDVSSGILLDSSPDSLQNGTKKASSSKTKRSSSAVSDPPVPNTIEIKKRRFGIFEPPSNIIDALKTNSSDEEHSKNSSAVGTQNPRNSRRKCQKPAKFLGRPIAQNSLSVEEKRPSPTCKRKKISSDNIAESTVKFRKRSMSEHNSETGENTHLLIRSKSLSPGLKKISCISEKNPPSKNSKSLLPRKRTNSFSHNDIRVKFRKSSTSSDEAEKYDFQDQKMNF